MTLKIKDDEGKLANHEGLVRVMVEMRLEALKLEADAEQLKDSANRLFATIREEAGVGVVETDQGTYRMVEKAGATKTDPGKFKDALLKRGVSSDVVMGAFDEATTVGKGSEYPAFYPTKEKPKKSKN